MSRSSKQRLSFAARFGGGMKRAIDHSDRAIDDAVTTVWPAFTQRVAENKQGRGLNRSRLKVINSGDSAHDASSSTTIQHMKKLLCVGMIVNNLAVELGPR